MMPAPNTPRQSARQYLMATACTGTFAFGTLVAFLGATLPELRARFGFDIAQGGTLISLTSSLFPEIFGTIFLLLMAAGFTGSMILPAAVGYVAKASTVKAGIWLLPISAFLLFVVQSIFVRREKGQQSSVPHSTA